MIHRSVNAAALPRARFGYDGGFPWPTGSGATTLPEGTGIFHGAGRKIALQVHYSYWASAQQRKPTS